MSHTIEVNGIQLYAYHGCLPEEAKIGGRYIVDVSLDTSFDDVIGSDDLADTVDYVTINTIVVEEMAIRSKLIEHVGARIVKRLKSELKKVLSLRVKITKLSPPINGNVVGVSIIIKE